MLAEDTDVLVDVVDDAVIVDVVELEVEVEVVVLTLPCLAPTSVVGAASSCEHSIFQCYFFHYIPFPINLKTTL